MKKMWIKVEIHEKFLTGYTVLGWTPYVLRVSVTITTFLQLTGFSDIIGQMIYFFGIS